MPWALIARLPATDTADVGRSQIGELEELPSGFSEDHGGSFDSGLPSKPLLTNAMISRAQNKGGFLASQSYPWLLGYLQERGASR